MKTKKEIKEMIAKCKALRKAMPHFSIFGTDNWGNLDVEVNTLTACIDLSERDVRDRLNERLAVLGDEDWCDDHPEVQACDWLINDTDDLVSDEDIEAWSKNGKEG